MTEFTKDNLPELFEYLAGYIRANPECITGFGLEYKQGKGLWGHSGSTLLQLISNIRSDYEYRIKPATRTVRGPNGDIECPAPLSVKPSEGQAYYLENPLFKKHCSYLDWNNDGTDNRAFDLDLCYATAEDAAANCRARYGIKEGE